MVAIFEPFSDAALAQHTKAVDGYLSQATHKWKGVPKAAPGTPFGLLQQNFEADMSLSFWKAFRDPNKGHTKDGLPNASKPLDAYYLPGYGDARRIVMRHPRSVPLSQQAVQQQSRLDMYLDQNLQHSVLGDVRSQASCTSAAAAPSCHEAHTASCTAGAAHIHAVAGASNNRTLATATPPDMLEATRQGPVPAQAERTHDANCEAALEAPGGADADAELLTPAAALPSSSCPKPNKQSWSGWQPCNRPTPASVKPDRRVAQHQHLFHVLLYAFVTCTVLLPLLWSAQQVLAFGGKERSAVVRSVRLWACMPFIPTFLYLALQPMQESWQACAALLHFQDDELEASFMAWFDTQKLPFDALLHVVWLVVPLCTWIRTEPSLDAAVQCRASYWIAVSGMLVPLLPTAAGGLMQKRHSPTRREALLVCAKLGYSLFNGHLIYRSAGPPQSQPSLSLPLVALAQLTTTVCMHVRLSAFLPVQLLHVAIIILGMGPQATMASVVQLFGFGFCLPVLLLYSTELYARKAFAARLSKATNVL